MNLLKQKALHFCLAAMLIAPNVAMAKDGDKTPLSKDIERSEVNYKQRHSTLISSGQSKVYADGIKIKRDLTILKEIQEQRILAADEIPAEELYGGLWNTQYVHSYGSLTNRPDTFSVDLTDFHMPISEGYVTSKYGPRGRRMHKGIDLKVQIGDTIYAAFDGKVRIVNYERRGYGKYVALRHPNGLETIYGHLSDYLVQVDDVVKAGDPIALGGNTGRSTGSHLHFEFRFLGESINPAEIVDFENFVTHRDQFMITKNTFTPPPAANKYKGMRYHRIRKGDSFYSIARKYGTSVAALCKANKMTTKSVLKVGSALKVQ